MQTERFRFPANNVRVICAGSSACGKTEWTKSVIEERHRLFEEPPDHIVWVYKWEQEFFKEFPYIQFVQEVPTYFESGKTLLIADDLIVDAKALKAVADLFVRGRHAGVSIIFITQNIFLDDSYFRLCSLNATHFVLFKSVRSTHQIRTLGRQIFSKAESEQFVSAYRDATSEPYNYLILDLTPNQDYRLRSHIFPNEEEVIYVLK